MDDQKNIYPYIGIFIRDNHAAVYFFEQEGQSPFSSKAPATLSLAADDILFYENPEGSEIFISFESVIAAVDAEMSAVEFFRLKGKPSCIDWDIF